MVHDATDDIQLWICHILSSWAGGFMTILGDIQLLDLVTFLSSWADRSTTLLVISSCWICHILSSWAERSDDATGNIQLLDLSHLIATG
ncbi:hypothetical protein RRG08_055857 [Elysia crispata]|uniref:Uncharacterized protein n=1 Tax=Elysia crispata TaxID=231223 RepID=A0AAE1DI98_9GAST|nr:hypothetical protein RRG08_055857 [Elysia crispata]